MRIRAEEKAYLQGSSRKNNKPYYDFIQVHYPDPDRGIVEAGSEIPASALTPGRTRRIMNLR